MVLRETLDPKASIKNLLAIHLHFLRTEHGYSCAYVGERVRAARQTVSHWESTLRVPDERQAEELDRLYGTGELVQALLFYATSLHEPEWFQRQVELEAKADVIQLYECQVIPGVLQTERYARTVYTVGDVSDVEKSVRERLSRQKTLTRPDPPRLWVLLEQDAMERVVGGPEVMREQIGRLLEISETPRVVLRIVPRSLAYHTGLLGAFKVLTLGRKAYAYTEAAAGGRLTEDPSEVRKMTERFDLLGADALSRDDTRNLLRRVQESMT
ncbi:DUF5753 domain-containing protein [Spirillospora sp. NPDC047279]|uniref:DUF5753 domain-containing protein n=1 Tax=Spirillospora sp. NPDC047279 TaxID=3155478 RepID=UPI0033C248E8